MDPSFQFLIRSKKFWEYGGIYKTENLGKILALIQQQFHRGSIKRLLRLKQKGDNAETTLGGEDL